MSVADNIYQIKKQLPPHVRLVAVSKTHPVSSIQEAYDAGQRIFGENKVQELCGKQELLPSDIEWHMIGHLQSNKVKYMASFVHTIHGVDSLKLAKEISRQAEKYNRTIRCLLQVHIASEETKFGFSGNELEDILRNGELQSLSHIQWGGVMGMATFTDDTEKVRSEFAGLTTLFEHIKRTFFPNSETFSDISMGMSGDWPVAVSEGSTLVRVGSAIFGQREA